MPISSRIARTCPSSVPSASAYRATEHECMTLTCHVAIMMSASSQSRNKPSAFSMLRRGRNDGPGRRREATAQTASRSACVSEFRRSGPAGRDRTSAWSGRPRRARRDECGAFTGLHQPWPLVPASARESRGDAAVDRLKEARGRVWLLARPASAAAQKLEAARSEDAGGEGPEHRIGLDVKRRC